MNRIRIAVDAAPAHAQPSGVGIYVRDLVGGLLDVDAVDIALLGVRRGGPLEVANHRAMASSGFRGRHYQEWLLRDAWAAAIDARADVVHFTNAMLPARPLKPARSTVLTIQDLSLFRHPCHHPWMRVATAPLVAISARRATVIVVPSTATRDEVRRLLGVSPNWIIRVPHAPSSDVRVERDVDPVDRARIERRLGLVGARYIVSVGTLEPRKNQRRLIAAFGCLAASHLSIRLVLVGGDGWREGALRADIRSHPYGDRITAVGYLPPDELQVVIEGASAFAYISLYEGFGLPIVELMLLGVPVVTSDRSSMPEVAGGAAILVDPYDVDAIATGLRTAMHQHDRLASAGRRRVAGRDWRAVAEETIEVYRWVAARAEGA